MADRRYDATTDQLGVERVDGRRQNGDVRQLMADRDRKSLPEIVYGGGGAVVDLYGQLVARDRFGGAAVYMQHIRRMKQCQIRRHSTAVLQELRGTGNMPLDGSAT